MTPADALEGPLQARVGPFEDVELERAYLRDYFQRSLLTVRVSLILGLVLYVSFGVLDRFVVPTVLGPVSWVRYGIVSPVLLGLVCWTYAKGFGPRHLQTAPVIALIFGGLGVVFFTAVGSVESVTLYYAGLLLSIGWAHALSRLSFRNATSVSVGLIVVFVLVETALGRTPGPLLITFGFYLTAALLIGMFASYNIEAAFRRDFLQRRLLVQRGDELQEYTQRLHDAEHRVSEIQEGAPQSIDNLPRWAERIANEIQRTLEAAEVRVWRLEGEQLNALTAGDSPAPPREALRAGSEMQKDAYGHVTVPLAGLTGEVFGAIVVTAPVNWDAPERRLVAGFARHLGGALEILEMRQELARAEERRMTARERMRARGVGAMQLCPTCGRCYDESHDRCEVDGTRLLARLIPFRMQDRYELVRLLGQGGMGQVFLARDEKLQRDVAIKVLLSEGMLDPEVRSQLAREARVVARIDHPGVVEVYDLGELEDGSAFIVMEFLTGRALSDQITTHGPGTPRQVATLLRQTSAALTAAHRMGVVHRDLKPQNVFLLSAGEGFSAKLVDFGVARVKGAEATTGSRNGRGQGGMFGTPAYMAPEQVRGVDADARSDLYALASVVFEALTGDKVVRHGASIAATLMSVLNDPPPVVSSRITGASRAVDEAFAAALSKDPEKRPADIDSWAEDLACLLEQVPGGAAGWPEPITTEQLTPASLRQIPESPSALPSLSLR
jgi:predicted Ser/Thr protein kinase